MRDPSSQVGRWLLSGCHAEAESKRDGRGDGVASTPERLAVTRGLPESNPDGQRDGARRAVAVKERDSSPLAGSIPFTWPASHVLPTATASDFPVARRTDRR
jgi:hypothetical protein